MNSRKLKIHTKYQARTYGGTTIPEIRLEGKWLEKLGFRKGVCNATLTKTNLPILIKKSPKRW